MTSIAGTTAGTDFTLDRQLCVALNQSARAITAAYRPHLREIGLTYSQYSVLLVLWEQESVPMQLLCDRLRLDSGTLSPLLKRLEATGAIVRERRRDDERTVQVTLTAAGRDLQRAAEGVQARVQEATGLTPSELADLRDQLRALTQRLQQDQQPVEPPDTC